MLQLERLNVVEETLDQLYDEVQEHKCDDNIEEVQKAARRCSVRASLLDSILRLRIVEQEEETNEDS